MRRKKKSKFCLIYYKKTMETNCASFKKYTKTENSNVRKLNKID